MRYPRPYSLSLTLLIVYAVSSVVMAFDAVTRPEHKYISLLMFAFGLTATWREYLNWRRDREGRFVR